MKRRLSNFCLIIALLVGLALLLYPSLSNYWNSLHQSQAISSYDKQVSVLDDHTFDQMWKDACEFNKTIPERSNIFLLTEEQEAAYWSALDLGHNGVMGYIKIPVIDVSLPIYHGTDESVLQIAVGHLEWSSLPVGGDSTHCVLSGHRGLPSAKLFTSLDKLTIGDTFVLNVLDQTLTYQVDKISIVEPSDTDSLLIEDGKDLCTLITCTPYGVNTHRLLVRGSRVDNAESIAVARVTADAIQKDPVMISVVLAIPMLLIAVIVMVTGSRKDERYLVED